jgi:hypothetical protein
VFPALDAAKVAQGEALYKKHCQGCHLPSVEELKADLRAEKPVYWVTNSTGKRFLDLRDVPLSLVGTDPNQAIEFKNRTAETGDLGQGRVSAAAGLMLANGFPIAQSALTSWPAYALAAAALAAFLTRKLETFFILSAAALAGVALVYSQMHA